MLEISRIPDNELILWDWDR